MDTREKLRKIMADNFRYENVVEDYKGTFEADIKGLIDQFDPAIEGFKDYKQQRDYSVKFAWGHNHDFGTFSLKGPMGNRHVEVIADFMDNFGLPHDLSGKKILDVGAWTGGTSLILSALGAQVTALEEVVKYSNTVNYLASAFGLSGLECKPISLYELAVNDIYDYVMYFGVIYHVTDPILSLRILFNSLKDSGRIFIETYGISGNDINKNILVCFEGPKGVLGRPEDLNRTGWNYFIPSGPALLLWTDAAGFSDVEASKMDSSQRIKCVGTRHKHEEMLQAGLSRPGFR